MREGGVCHVRSSVRRMRRPSQVIQGTAMLLPSALYRGPSAAGLPRYWIAVQSSGNHCRRSHSRGVRRRTADAPTTVLSRAPPPPASSPLRILAAAAASFHHPCPVFLIATATRSEEHTSELQSIMRISYAVFCLKQ